MRALLEAESDLEVVGEGGDGHEVLRLCDDLKPDVLVVDIAMPKLNGIDVADRAVKHNPARVLHRFRPQRVRGGRCPPRDDRCRTVPQRPRSRNTSCVRVRDPQSVP